MMETPQRRYLDDVPKDLQDLIFDQRPPEAIELLMEQRGLGKMQAGLELARLVMRMKEHFPDAFQEVEPPKLDSVGSGRMKSFMLWTLILVLLAGGFAAIFFGTRGVMRAKASTDWPIAQGKIIESSVERETRRRTSGSTGRLSETSYRAKISYKYSVDETSYSGSRVAYGDHGKIANSKRIGVKGFKIGVGGSKSARSHAQGIVKLYPKGKTVSVYYMPENPKESLLEPGLALQAFGWPVAGIILLAIGGFIASVTISVARDEWKAAEQMPAGDERRYG